MSFAWWTEPIRIELSQGDIVTNVEFGLLKSPTVHLRTHQFRGSEQGWKECPAPVLHNADQKTYALAARTTANAMIVSHDCAIDKPSKAARVLAAPIAALTSLTPEIQTTVIAQRHLALMPLPGIVGLGDCYADLRLLTAVPRAFIDAGVRVASMTEDARERLHAQLAGFLFLREIPSRRAEA